MSVTPDPIGTEPVVDPAAGGGGVAQPEPADDADLKRRYEENLTRLTDLERRAHEAEERERAAQDRLNAVISERMGESRPTASHPQDDGEAVIRAMDAHLENLARNGEDEATRLWARDQQMQREFLKNLPRVIRHVAEISGVEPSQREQIEAVQGEARRRGEHISVATAREILTLREKAKEIDKLRAGPPAPAPAGTAARPSPVPLASDEMTESEYRRQMATATDEQRTALFHRKQSGSLKVRRG